MQTKVISRGNGQSAIASAAYRSGERLFSEEDNRHKYYAGKQPEIVYSKIHLPEHAPEQYKDRATLWNAVQAKENKSNSRFAREVIIALPGELNTKENIALVKEYAQDNFVSKGMIADINIHDKRDGNPHAHIMLTVRPINERGEWGEKQKKIYQLDKNGNKIYDPVKKTYKCTTRKNTDWDKKETLEKWRESWSQSINREFQYKGINERVSHLSYEAQGINKIPTVHMGRKVDSMEKLGMATERGERNRQAVALNREYDTRRSAINQELKQLPTVEQVVAAAMTESRKAPQESQKQTPVELTDQMKSYIAELEKQSQGKQYQEPRQYEIKQNALQQAAKPQIDYYSGVRQDIKETIAAERFAAHMDKETAFADKKIKEHGQSLVDLEQYKPKSILGLNKDAVMRWEADCRHHRQQINHFEKLKDPKQHTRAQAEIIGCVGFNDIEAREKQHLAKLTPQEVQQYEKAKKIKSLMDEVRQKTTSLDYEIRKQRQAEQNRSRNQDKNLGRGR